jgi:riboflavin kinase / FMN adenylyltransferase
VQLWSGLNEIPPDVRGGVVTIGNFDGVHLGHRAVLADAVNAAKQLDLDHVIAVTFDPHPIAVLRPEHAPPTLTTMVERSELLAEAGADAVIALPFDLEMARWSPGEFIHRVLLNALAARAVVVGSNFRFGARAAGDVSTLREAGLEHGFAVHAVELQGGPMVWSSTYLRHCLVTGDIEGAVQALGRPVTVRGGVVVGDQRGRELGFPTANIAVPDASLTPGDGVYAGWLHWHHERFPAAISVGTNPTFAGERARRVEVYVLDRDDLNLYGEAVIAEFDSKIRDMSRFEKLDDLLAAMANDVEITRERTHG